MVSRPSGEYETSGTDTPSELVTPKGNRAQNADSVVRTNRHRTIPLRYGQPRDSNDSSWPSGQRGAQRNGREANCPGRAEQGRDSTEKCCQQHNESVRENSHINQNTTNATARLDTSCPTIGSSADGSPSLGWPSAFAHLFSFSSPSSATSSGNDLREKRCVWISDTSCKFGTSAKILQPGGIRLCI